MLKEFTFSSDNMACLKTDLKVCLPEGLIELAEQRLGIDALSRGAMVAQYVQRP